MGKSIPLDVQLKAACTVHWYAAARVIGVYHWGKMNGVPDLQWFTDHFTFTPDELLGYIRAAGIGRYLLDRAGDNRGFPSAYFTERQSGYEVGWVEVEPVQHSGQRFFTDLDEAAADYVLAFWRLGRLPILG